MYVSARARHTEPVSILFSVIKIPNTVQNDDIFFLYPFKAQIPKLNLNRLLPLTAASVPCLWLGRVQPPPRNAVVGQVLSTSSLRARAFHKQ
jgi:hypothetical protein